MPSETLVVSKPATNGQKLTQVEQQRCLICSGSKVIELACRNCIKPIVLRCTACNRKSWAEEVNSCKCSS